MDRLPPARPLLGMEPATRACALDRDSNPDLLAPSEVDVQPRSPAGRAVFTPFIPSISTVTRAQASIRRRGQYDGVKTRAGAMKEPAGKRTGGRLMAGSREEGGTETGTASRRRRKRVPCNTRAFQ
ncbi:hypothetical protein D623_10020234 [Myotis brandtii]|uniref:Uncharacterized protein n=1 Tax=Myotis brandtii TaxID=109478 RepID=S7NJK9_MYOBR|nr:hypothetical protein D623_10020234 [Myotis brandtii]